MSSSLRVGVVLGAGGTPGGAYIRAALAEITERTGWSVSSATTLVGTSVGALNAARQPLPEPSRSTTADHLEALARLGAVLTPPDSSPLTPIVARARSFGGRAAARLAPAGSHAQGYEVADAPYHPGVVVVSVHRGSGRRRVVRLVDASSPKSELYASAAVPGYAAPVVIDGQEYIDGAVWSSTNADLVGVDDHDALVVVAPMVADTGGSPLARTHRAQLIVELRPWVDAGKPIVVVTPSGDEQQLRPDQNAFAAAGRARVVAGWSSD